MMKSIIAFLFYLFMAVPAMTQTASLLPQGRIQFFDNNGNPLAGGKVYNYIVGTTTPKTTWQDSSESVANTNPIILDSAGRALIYGQGAYRQIVRDANNNLIWDAVTSSTGSGSSSSATGDGDLVGTVKPWAGLTAPNQYAFAYGQELSRTTYSSLLTAITLTTNVNCTSASNILSAITDTTSITIGSPVEATCIPSGTTVISKTSSTVTVSNPASLTVVASAKFFPFGNGNGTTTFNLPDLRGYVLAGRDNMGGVSAARLTTTYFGANDPNALGATGGSQSNTIAQANLPAVTLNTTIAAGQGAHTHTATTTAGLQSTQGSAGGATFMVSGVGAVSVATATLPSMTGTTPLGGSGTAISRIQPTVTMNYIIKVTPDTSSAIATGVTDIQGMTGSIACGSGLICTGNTITATGGSGSGTVTSVAMTVPSQFSVSGSPITSSGTLAVTLTSSTGSGAVVLANTPTLITPILGVATATSLTASCGASCPGVIINGNTSAAPAPINVGVMLQLNGRDSATSAGVQHDAYGVAPQYIFRFANNTQASPTDLVSGDTIGSIQGRGYANGGYTSARGRINIIAGENWTATEQGGLIQFQTTALTTTNTVATRLEIGSNGTCLFGSASGSTCLVVASTASGTLTLPSATDTLVGRATTDTLTNKTWNGVTITVPYGGTGQTAFTAGLPVIGDGANSLTQGAISGNTSIFATIDGALTPDNCIKSDADGNLVDAGATCGSGGGGSPAGSSTYIQYNTAGAFDASASLTFTTDTLKIGVASSITGILQLTGGTGGTLSVRAPTSFTDWTLIFPATVGTSGQVLTSAGAGSAQTWTTLATVATTGAISDTTGTLAVARGGTGAVTFTANMPLIGNGTSAIAVGTVSGNTTEFATVSGALVAGNCLSSDASGNVIDTGGSCNSAPAGADTQVQFNNTGAFGASANLTWVSPALTIGVANSTSGQLKLANGAANFTTTVSAAPTANYNFILPATAGTTGQALLSGGGSTMTFGTLSVAAGGTGATTFTSNLPLIGNGTGAIAQGTRSGNTTQFVTTTGALTSGDCVKIDASGNFIANGSACGTSSPGGSNTQVQYNNVGSFAGAAGFTFNGTAAVTIGVNVTSTGTLILANGGSSGQSVTIQNNATTSAWNFNLPTSAGSSGAPLCSAAGGSSPMTWCTLGATFGGTGQTVYVVGDLLYASTTTVLSRLAAGASGTMLQASGAGVAPAWTNAGFLSVSLTSPIHYGGSAASSTLSLRSTSSGAPSGDAINMYTAGSLRMNLNSSGNSSWTGSMTLSAGRFNQTYTPVYDLISSTTAVASLIGFASNPTTVSASTNLRGIWLATAAGADFSFVAGANSQICGVCSTITATSGSSASSAVYASVLHAINAGPGTTRGIHAGGFATSGATGVISGVASQIEPVATLAGAYSFYTSLTSSGVNDIATAYEILSTGDRFGFVICGGCVSALPVGFAMLHWTVSASSSAGARFLQLYNSSTAEIMYVHKDGTVATLDGTAGAPAYTFTADTDTGMFRVSANTLGFTTVGTEALRLAAGVATITDNGGQASISLRGSANASLNLIPSGTGAIQILNGSSGFVATFSNNAGATASTNYFNFVNSAAGGVVTIMQSLGVDTNINMIIAGKGTGAISLRSDAFVNWLDATGVAAASSATVAGTIVYGGIGVAKASYIGSNGFAGVVLTLQNSAGTCTHTPTSGSETVSCSSDERLKRHIVDASPALPYIKSFHIRDYEVISDGEKTTGVVAQELKNRQPTMVREGLDGYLTVDSPNIWKLTKAIQELSAANDNLKAEIEQLKRGKRR